MLSETVQGLIPLELIKRLFMYIIKILLWQYLAAGAQLFEDRLALTGVEILIRVCFSFVQKAFFRITFPILVRESIHQIADQRN